MRRIFTFALVSLLVFYFCAFAFADAMLYRGQDSIEAVPSVDKDKVMCVSLEDLGRIMGFSSQKKDDELVMTRGNAQIRVSLGAAAGWYGYSIIPLYSAPFEQDGKFWIDAKSAAALFQGFSGRGVANRLHFARITGSAAYVSGVNDFGDFGEQNSSQPLTAKKHEPKTDLNEIINRTVITKPAPQQTQTAQIPQEPQIQPSQSAQTAPAETVANIPQDQPIQSAQTQPSEKKSSGKSQPRVESFRPDDSRKEDGADYSGTIQGVRWTVQEGTHKRIRAVIMAEEESDPQVFMDGGKLHALFSSSLENSKSIASPYTENIKAEIKQEINGIDLIFTPKEITKAEKLVLNNPRRIVFDFFYPEDTNIVVTSPAQTTASIPAQLPGQVSEPQSESTSAKMPAPANPDPVISSNPPENYAKTPAVKTPPSTITIPTSPQAAQRLGRVNNGRKTVVIDPGHGGKDPGASYYGIREKDINLSVGLELQKVLTEKGYNAVMTRATDVYLKLQERTDIANNVEADLFVSVHVNALPSKKSMSGFEIYIMALPTDKDAMNLAKIENREYVEGKGMDTENVDRRTEMLLRILGDLQQNNKISESTDFAAMLYNAGVRSGLPMRRVAQAPFFVLRGAGMPAVLLEIGFVTNENEANLLTTPAYQQRIANAMSEGIANYIR